MSRQYAIDPKKLAADLGIPPEERDILLIGGDHPYDCRCDVCREWWKSMGPDPETGECGGFTMEELGLDPRDYLPGEYDEQMWESIYRQEDLDDLGSEFWHGPFSS